MRGAPKTANVSSLEPQGQVEVWQSVFMLMPMNAIILDYL